MRVTNHTQGAGDADDISNSRSILIKGFGFITLFIVTMAAIGFFLVLENQQRIELILDEQTEMRAIFSMRDAALQRTFILRHMAMLEDEFDRDTEYMKLKVEAEKFIKAREIFLNVEALSANEKVLAIWKAVQANIRIGADAQAQIAEMILNDEIERANQIILNEAIPMQNRILAQLTDMLELQRKKAETEANDIYQQNTTGLIFISMIAAWSLFWGISISRYTVRHITRFEESLDNEKLKAQDADQQKSRFLANMSHEIRTPLTAIIGYSETLNEDKHTPDREHYIDRIFRNSKHLHQLINNILDLSKMEAKQLRVESIPVSLCELVSEIESLMGERARKKGLLFKIQYHFPLPKTIHSDPTRLKQILLNLCGNAIKFTEKGEITLALSYDKLNDKICFNVKDTGIGISQKQAAKLFKPFKQADASTTRKYGGTGLGLYISRQLTECLGGELSLDGQSGDGSQFNVIIDAGDKHNKEWLNSEKDTINPIQKSPTAFVIPSLRGKVLLAEDTPDNQAIISLHVKKTGAEIKVVGNGRQAVDAAMAESFDLVIMDTQMPIMDGIEAIKVLREKNNQTPIATLTANAMKEDVQQSLDAGANDFLSKPIDRKAFYAMLKKYLSPNQPMQQQTNHNLDDIHDLIDRYVSQLPATCCRIAHYVNTTQWEKVKDEIHQLKGTGSAFGLPEITQQCADIEKYLSTKNFSTAQSLITLLNNTCTKIHDAHIPSTITQT